MKMFHLFMFSSFLLKISVLLFICELMRTLFFYTEHAKKMNKNNKDRKVLCNIEK